MRLLPLAVALVLLVAVPPSRAEEVREVAKVNKLLNFDGCVVAPGESCDFVIHVANPYATAMNATNLSVEVYSYATIEAEAPVDAAWAHAYPGLDAPGVRFLNLILGDLPPGYRGDRSFRFLTSVDMPHGSVLSQASYGLRFWMEFDFVNVTVQRREFASWHHFSAEAIRNATDYAPPLDPCPKPWCYGDVNLSALGIDGLLPDSAVSVHAPFPAWPFYLLGGGAALFLVLAVFLHAEENPSDLPRTARAGAYLRGKARQALPARRRT